MKRAFTFRAARQALRLALCLTQCLILCLAASGCYLTHGGPTWRDGAATIAVPMVVSHLRSDELTRSLEPRVTAELRRRASQGDLGGLTLSSPDGADLRLAIELIEVAQKVIRVDLYNVPIERQVVIRARYTLTGTYGEQLATGVADSRVSALAGDYDITRAENSEQGRDSAIRSIAQAIIEAINDDRLKAADTAAANQAAPAGARPADTPPAAALEPAPAPELEPAPTPASAPTTAPAPDEQPPAP